MLKPIGLLITLTLPLCCMEASACDVDLDGGTAIVSEEDTDCFVQVTEYWWDVSEGHDGHHYYTIATDAASEETYGEWLFTVSVPGEYLVEVHIPDTEANAEGAVYQIEHGGGTTEVPINQATQKGWQALGSFSFDGSAGEVLHLGDNTGEPESDGKRLAYDAARFTFQSAGDDDDASDDDDDDAGGDDDDDAGDGWLDHLEPPPDDDGCQCSQVHRPVAPTTALLAALLLTAWARRRTA